MNKKFNNIVKLLLAFLIVAAPGAIAQETTAAAPEAIAQEGAVAAVFKPEELEQLVAPIALYPDSLLSQILMASTYPLEVVQADRWVKENKDIKGDALAEALNKQTWDPSVKSLVNFPQVLSMMSEKLDLTQKLGDAFLAQQKDVMAAVQKLRSKANEEGALKTTEQQVVKTEQQTIIIESADPEVIYVPTYDPGVVYGTWAYPSYPPYSYYPPGYVAGSNLLSFGLGVAAGAAWGWAWGDCDWGGGDIDIDINRNFNSNRNIDRGKYAQQFGDRTRPGESGRGTWQHNPANRKGVAYRDQGIAQKFNRASTADAVKSREAFRGRAEQGRQELASGGADRLRGQQDISRPSGVRDAGGRDLSSRGTQRTAQERDAGTRDRAASRDVSSRGSSSRGGAFQGIDRGSSARNSSSRGSASRGSMSRPSGGGMRGGGGGRGGGGRGGRR